MSEGSIQIMTLRQHGLPGTALQVTGTAHLSESTVAERSLSHVLSKTWHDSIDSVILLYGVQLYRYPTKRIGSTVIHAAAL